MNKKVLIGMVVAGMVIVGGITAYVLRPTPDATAPIEAIPVEMEEDRSETIEEEMAQENGIITFVIDPSSSEVRFTLDEILRGNPTTVIGTTDQVAGEIAIDFENPGNSKVGTILINARTLATDNDFRNRAINNEILDTGEFEFITFTPTALVDFPENPQFGEEFNFQIVGDLTIRDITREVVFDVNATAVSETQIQGYGSTMVARADYDLKIPNVPSVANVDEEVLLEIEFVANAK